MLCRIGLVILFFGAMMGENETLTPALLTMTFGAALLVMGGYIERRRTDGK